MRIKRLLIIPALILLANLAMLDAMQAPAARATGASAPGALSASSVEIAKVTLNETAIDAPALWTTTNGVVRGVLAWTDSTYHLNVMTTAIGTKFGNKARLAATSA